MVDNIQRDALSRLNIHSLNLKPLDVDPADARDGDIWYRQDLGQYRTMEGVNARVLLDLATSIGAVVDSDGTPLLTGCAFKRPHGSNLPSGTTDLYTVPAGKRAMVHSLNWYNPTVNPILVKYLAKIGASYYGLSAFPQFAHPTIEPNGAGPLDFISNNPGYIYEAGETLAVNTNNVGANVWANVLEYDASVAIFSAKLSTFVSGDNTLYTVPAGKSARILDNIFEPYARTTSRMFTYTNYSGVTVLVDLFLVPDGDVPSTGNKLFPTWPVLNNEGTVLASPVCLVDGDSIVVNTNMANSGQFAWINVVEI